MEEKRIVKPWQAGLMLLVGIAVIIVGLLVMKLNNRIVLALDGVIMCLMAWCFGIPYAELQQGIKETVSSMIVAILILLAVGVLVGTWMASGTVPVMIYYGMKVLTPGAVPAGGVHPLHPDVHHGGHLLGHTGHRGRGLHGRGRALASLCRQRQALCAPARSSATRSLPCLTLPLSPPPYAMCLCWRASATRCSPRGRLT